MPRLVLAISLFSLVACGTHTASNTPDGPPPDAAPYVPGDAPPLTGTPHMLTWGPVTVQPSEESTQCIWVRLDNDTEIKVHQLHNVLSPTSHHLIVYKDDMDTTEQTTPMPCQPFTGALNTTGMVTPIVITQKKDDEITLPDGVAYTFAPHQMVKLEMHYINATDTAQQTMATVTFYAADPATIHDEAAILFTGTPDINLPPNAMTTVHEFFTVPSTIDLSQAHIFAVTGHEHQMGTGVEVNVAPSKTGTMTPVYNPMPFQWSEPVTEVEAPDFSVPKGGGFDFTCTWYNSSSATIKFGESANDEMCFFWAYYWPSQGSKVCIHTDQYGGANGFDMCCPGDSLCSQLGF
jgi:hypothetical protein